MTEKEVLTRVITGNFNNDFGFNLQLLIDTVGALGEMFRNKQISEVVRCKDCIWYDQRDGQCEHHICINNTSPDWFCADGEMIIR